MGTQKKVMLSLALAMSLSSIVADDFRVSGMYIIFAGISLFLGLPDKKV